MLDAARKAAQKHVGKVADGKDPAAERAEQRAEQRRRSGSTLGALLAEGGEYERHLKRRHIVNTKVIMSGLRRGLARLTSKDVDAISDHVAALLSRADAKGKIVAIAARN